MEEELGRGSFGAVRAAWAEDEAEQLAVKQVACKSRVDLDRALFEVQVMRRVGRSGVSAPHVVASEHERVDAGWRVLVAMERIRGESVHAFEQEHEGGYSLGKAARFTQALVAEMARTFAYVSRVAFHRDVTPQNVQVCTDTPWPQFTLMDFGVAVDAKSWTSGEWRNRELGGDARYWPTSAWQVFIGESLAPGSCEQYVHMLDHHGLGLTALQLFLVLAPKHKLFSLRAAWASWWEDTWTNWDAIHSIFRNGGDEAAFNRVKADFRMEAITTRSTCNAERLDAELAAAAEEPKVRHLCIALKALLGQQQVSWSDITKALEDNAGSDCSIL